VYCYTSAFVSLVTIHWSQITGHRSLVTIHWSLITNLEVNIGEEFAEGEDGGVDFEEFVEFFAGHICLFFNIFGNDGGFVLKRFVARRFAQEAKYLSLIFLQERVKIDIGDLDSKQIVVFQFHLLVGQ